MYELDPCLPYNITSKNELLIKIFKALLLPVMVFTMCALIAVLFSPQINQFFGIKLIVVQPQYEVPVALLVVFSIICIILTLYYRLKKSDLYKDSIRDNNPQTRYLLYITQNLDLSCLKYNCIGVTSLLVIMTALSIIAFITISTYENQINTLTTIPNDNLDSTKITAIVTILLARTAIVGAFSVMFLISLLKFTIASFNQAIIFSQRKHATLFLMQIIINCDDHDSIKSQMQGFELWNMAIPTSLSLNKEHSDGKFENDKHKDKLYESFSNAIEKFSDKYFNSENAGK